MDTPKNNFNPYAAPPPDFLSLQDDADGLTVEQRKLVKDFHSQTLALGVLWIFFAVVIGVLAIVLLARGDDLEDRGILASVATLLLGIICVVYAIAGVGTLLRKPWGIYTGLVITYIGLVGNLLRINICALFISIAVLIQSHRILGFMSQMRKQGISLNTRPLKPKV